MTELKILEYRFSKKYQDVFEDIATLMFCTEIGLSKGVNRRTNQKAIEADPVYINGKMYAYQAKYYEASTKLSSHKKDFIESILGASIENVTDLYFFINKNKSDKNHGTEEEPEYIRLIEEAAIRYHIKLHWWTLSKIESSLDMPKFIHIREKYFDSEKNSSSITAFYEEAVHAIEYCPINSVYGDISLKDGYIEPHLKIANEPVTVKEYLERWVMSNETITIIHGEPGHGKTSMCWKAMYDAYKKGWLAGLVDNVFNFSLNPVNTSLLVKYSLSITALLSWGLDRMNSLSVQDCHNALIFFDAYDELIECVSTIEFQAFIDCIKEFQMKTNSHIVITSRSMAVDTYLEENHISFYRDISAFKLQPISFRNQLAWIDNYSKNCQHVNKRAELGWDNYIGKYMALSYSSQQILLGIPTIFRMVVVAQFLPNNALCTSKMYDELFNATWSRHSRPIFINSAHRVTKEWVFQTLQELAFKIYLDNTDTATTKAPLETPWIFSFYTKRGSSATDRRSDEKRFGFLHKSFYHYFLAHEVLSWFKKYAIDEDERSFKNSLSFLSRRRLDVTTLSFIEEIYDLNSIDQYNYDKSFEKAYEIIKLTDGIYELLRSEDNDENIPYVNLWEVYRKTDIDVSFVNDMSHLELANNIFWNIITICGICGTPLNKNIVNEYAIATYDLSDSCLKGAELDNVNLRNARLRNANLSESHLKGADLRSVDCVFANFNGANLKNANLKGADLFGANLRSNLEGADLSFTDLGRANLCEANLQFANCSKANLRGAILSRADFRGVCIDDVDIIGAYFSETKIREVDIDSWEVLGIDKSTLSITLDEV